jgi:hypothetical protein
MAAVDDNHFEIVTRRFWLQRIKGSVSWLNWRAFK